jgi:hypothetical protein
MFSKSINLPFLQKAAAQNIQPINAGILPNITCLSQIVVASL